MALGSNSHIDGKSKRARLRVPTSCTSCRRRKMKCDQARPICSTCKKNKSMEPCIYEDQPWSPNSEVCRLREQNKLLRDQVRELRKVINDSKGSNESVFDRNMKTETIDPVIDFSKRFRLMFINQNSINYHGPTSYLGLLNNDSYMGDMFSGFLKKQEMIFRDDNLLDDNAKFHSHLKEVTLCPDLRPSFEVPSYDSLACKGILENVNRILPKGIVFNFLINHFFSFTYNLFPFVDEGSFRGDLMNIVTIDSADNVCLKIKEPRILSTVALLLIILRLTFISLPLKAYLKEYELKYNTLDTVFVHEKFKKDIHIGPSFIELAKECLSNLKWLQTPSLKVIQTLLMLKVYRKYAPEDADEMADSSVILSAIIQLARIHGLHRDPRHFPIIENQATKMIWRRIWHALLFIDAEEAYIKGYPLLISDDYDTELPPGDSELSSKDQIANKYMEMESLVTNLTRDIVMICTLKAQVKRSEIEALLELIEDILTNKMESIESIISYKNLDHDNARFVYKSKELVLRLKVIGAKCVLNRILYSTCSEFEDLHKKRYKSQYVQCALVILRISTRFAENPLFVSPSNSIEFFLAAELASLAFYRAAQPVFSLICETSKADTSFLEHEIYQDTTRKANIDANIIKSWLFSQSKLPNYRENLIICFEKFLQFSIKKSKKYFRFWRISTVLSCYHDFLSRTNPSLFNRIREQFSRFDISQEFADNNEDTLAFKFVKEKDMLEWKHFVNKSGYRDFDYTCITKNNLYSDIDLNDPYFKDFDDHLSQPYNEDYRRLQVFEKLYLCNVDNLLLQLRMTNVSPMFDNYFQTTIVECNSSMSDFYDCTYGTNNFAAEFNNEKLLNNLSDVLFL